jgi:flagellar basal-body rod modification protein FlgD
MTVNGVSPQDAAAVAAKPAAAAGQSLGKETFLKLLIAQVRNQDPLNPADGLQFVTQLAQFSELEQVMAIRQDIEAIRKQAEAAAPADPAAEVPSA